MKKQEGKYTVFMTGPAETVKGGMRTVVNQYLSFDGWENIHLRYIPTHMEGSSIKKALFFGLQLLKLLADQVREKADIIHMHVSERGSFFRKSLVLGIFRFLGAKTVLHHHGAEFFPFFDNASPAVRRYIIRTVEKADVNLVLSKYHLGMMQERFPKGKFQVLYNAITPAEGGVYDPEASGILFVGRLGQRKGTYDLVEALAELDDSLPPEVTVSFCGDGEVEKTAALLKQKHLEHRAAHTGWCRREQLQKLYRQSMLFILPSYHEGLPMSLLEAMYAGLPCITTNTDGMPEVVCSGINGLLMEPGNLEQMKDCILKLANDRELRQKLGNNGHMTVREQFLLESHVEKLKNIYSEMKR